MGAGGLSYQRVIFLAEVDTPLLTMGIERDHRPEIDKKTELSFSYLNVYVTQSAFTDSNLAIEILYEDVKYIQGLL